MALAGGGSVRAWRGESVYSITWPARNRTWANLGRQLQGMEPHLESPDAPGEWTTRQVLCLDAARILK